MLDAFILFVGRGVIVQKLDRNSSTKDNYESLMSLTILLAEPFLSVDAGYWGQPKAMAVDKIEILPPPLV